MEDSKRSEAMVLLTPVTAQKKWRESSFYGSLGEGRCLKGDPQQEVNGHHSGSLDCTVVGLGEFKIFQQKQIR